MAECQVRKNVGENLVLFGFSSFADDYFLKVEQAGKIENILFTYT